jgi:hypothetical protein
MSIITKEIIQHLLEKCIRATLENVQRQVSDSLPEQLYLTLEAFGQHEKKLSLDEVMFFLYRDGTFPRIVDIAVRGIKNEHTWVWIRPSGHSYVSDFTQTWNTPEGMGPFKSLGLMLPSEVWRRSRPLSIQDLREAGEN